MPAKQTTKRPEIVVATWPNSTGAQFFGDRHYPSNMGCDSMWLSLRVVDDDSYAAYVASGTMSNIGLWVWFSTTNDSISVEFRAHDVHSATEQDLARILSELRRLNKRIPQRLHGQGCTDYVMATLRAAGIKRLVEYRGIGVPEQYQPLAYISGHLVAEIGRRSAQCTAA